MNNGDKPNHTRKQEEARILKHMRDILSRVSFGDREEKFRAGGGKSNAEIDTDTDTEILYKRKGETMHKHRCDNKGDYASAGKDEKIDRSHVFSVIHRFTEMKRSTKIH